jgi:uncharacterized repeat protein (TIGR03803 family)
LVDYYQNISFLHSGFSGTAAVFSQFQLLIMMKTSRLLFLILFLLGISGFQSNAQQLWGIADAGGANGLGVIFKINIDGTAYEVIYSFSASTGHKTGGKLMRANDGFFMELPRLAEFTEMG